MLLGGMLECRIKLLTEGMIVCISDFTVHLGEWRHVCMLHISHNLKSNLDWFSCRKASEELKTYP